MGVCGFWNVVSPNGKKIKDLYTKQSLKDMEGLKLAIDASLVIHESIFAGKKFANKDPDAYLVILKRKILMYNRYKIKQIWVFDCEDMNVEKQFAKKITIPQMNKNHIQMTMKLLNSLGVKYIIAKKGHEAEEYCARLNVDGVIGRDSDTLMFGAKRLYINVGGGVYRLYELNTILEELGLTMKGFIKMGVILGNDFNKKTPGIGPKTVIHKLGTIKMTKEQKRIFNYYSKK